jgi:hypothetical protein
VRGFLPHISRVRDGGCAEDLKVESGLALARGHRDNGKEGVVLTQWAQRRISRQYSGRPANPMRGSCSGGDTAGATDANEIFGEDSS